MPARSGATDRPPTNVRRAVLGIIGLAVGLILIFVGINMLSGSDAPPADAPRVQTGSLPVNGGSATATSTGSTAAGSGPVPPTTVSNTSPR